MRKIIISVISILVLGALWYVVSPFFFDKKVSEVFPTSIAENATTTPEVIATGTFTGFDRLHQGSGMAKLIRSGHTYIVRFEDDFQVTNGPDLYVGFGKDGKYIPGSEVATLKGNIGSQNYEVPEGFDLNAYNEVWIWCQRFSVPFAKAELLY